MSNFSSVPSDSIYLDFPRTDGDASKWPTDKLDPTPIHGEVNYMRPIAHDEPLCIKWRTLVGREVAKLLGLENHQKHVLKRFPEGYKFYHHNKGSIHDPRTDPYLYGSPSGRYRSPPEFIRHAYWLMTDDTLNRTNCACKYCGSSKQSQKEISQDLGLKSATASAPGGTHVKPKVRPVAQPRKRQSPSGSVVNHDRTLDLRSFRRFRQGELVWCALSPAIEGEHLGENIEFWPGLVNETRLKSDVSPHEPGEPFHVVQSTVYKVKLLGVMHSYVLPENAILPYQAYGPSIQLIERLRLAGDPALLKNSQGLSVFHPIPLSAEPENMEQLRFAEAATPFALAIQIAAHLVRLWTPSDEWKFHGEIPMPSATTLDSPATVEITETRHQGLWWGAERIWADELVRLQPGRAQVVPQGSKIIHRASPRADGRGVLMRINGIFAIPEGAPKDTMRECKVAGVLYELADEAYEEELISESAPQDFTVSASDPTAPGSSVSSALLSTNGSVTPVDTLLTPMETATAPVSALSLPRPPVPPPPGTSPINLPNLPSYPLPKPPPGYKFRSIMKPGYEIVLDVSLIAGRYYPDLLRHPLLQNALADMTSDETRVPQLTALCGLLPGAVNSMECVDWAGTRLSMIKLADVKAQQDLNQHWHPPSPLGQDENVDGSHGDQASKPDIVMDGIQSQDVEMKDIQP